MNKNQDNPAQVCPKIILKNAISLLFKPVFPVLKKHDNFTYVFTEQKCIQKVFLIGQFELP